MSAYFLLPTPIRYFGHGNIIKYSHRPFLKDIDIKELECLGGRWNGHSWEGKFSSEWRISKDAIDMMNDHLIDQINNVVGTKDTLWHLGDFAFAKKGNYLEKYKFYRDRINCQNIKFVIGNHDKRSGIKSVFPESYDMTEIKINGQLIVLCHYALATWNKSHRGSINLYGHSHSELEPWMNKHMPNRRSMDVGVDNIAKLLGEYRPVSLEEVLEITNKNKDCL